MLACSLSRENSVSCNADAAANDELVGASGPKYGNGPAVFIDFEELAVSEIGRSDIGRPEEFVEDQQQKGALLG